GLDVFAGEPNIHPAYRELPNVFGLPHIGSSTERTRVAMGQLLCEGIEAFFTGEKPVNQVACYGRLPNRGVSSIIGHSSPILENAMPGLLTDVDPDGLLEYSVVYTVRAVNHMSARFQQAMRDISRTLKHVYKARSAVIVPGSGTFGMEAVAR